MTGYRSIGVRCAAKINLYLDVLRRRPDGYHDIETFFQPVSLCDEIRIAAAEKGVELKGDDPSIHWDATNLCYRAAELLIEKTGYPGGAIIEVKKRIPHGAGLGGGSSDAAAVLFGLDKLYGLELGPDKLSAIALEIGSDVPFFLCGGPAVGRGRGELLERMEGLKSGYILIVKPPDTVSTAWAYDKVKIVLTRTGEGDRLNYLLKGLKVFPDIILESYNSFESIVAEAYPKVRDILRTFKDEGAVLSSLSGSGAACFALFGEEERARKVKDLYKDRGYFTRIAQPVHQVLELFQWE